MASEIVGLGSVPNVYISKIGLSDNNTTSFNVTVNMELMDLVSSGDFLWSNVPLFYNFLRIGVITTSNTNLNDSLKSGTLSALPQEIKKSPYYDDTTRLKVMSLNELRLAKTTTSKRFYGKSTTSIPHTTQNYFVYVYAFIDTVAISRSLQIDMSGGLKYYCGPLKSEVVFSNGSLQQITSLFLKPDNTPWSGPVHRQGNTYMAGAQHTSTPHPTLRKVTVQNLKLTDSRTPHWKNRLQLKNQITPFISDLHYSFNNKINLNGLFIINMRQLMLSKVKNARKILGLSTKMFDELMNNVVINSMSVVRQQVKTIRSSNKLGTLKFGTAKVNSYYNVSTTRESSANNLVNTANLQQIYLNKNSSLRYYQFIDPSMTSQSKGEYKYKLMFTIKDQTQKFIDSKIAELSAGFNELKTSIEMLNGRRSFNYKQNKLNEGVVIPSSILNSIRTYYNSLSYLKSLSNTRVNQMINKTMLSFMVSTYNPKEAGIFLKRYNDLISTYRKKFPSAARGVSLKKPKSIKKSFQPGIIHIEKTWDDIISFNELRKSYDYLGIKDNAGMALMSITDLQARGDQETNRLFETKNAISTPEISTLPLVVQDGIKDISTSKLNFLAPISFNLDKEEINILDMASVDTDKLTNNFMKMQEIKKRTIRPSKRILKKKSRKKRKVNRKLSKRKNQQRKRTSKARFKISLKRIPLRITTAVDKDKMIKASEFLGKTSEFTRTVELNKIIIPEQDKVVMTERILSSVNIQTHRNKENFDLEAPNNFLKDVMLDKKFSKSTLKRAPNHFKALIASRSDGVRNNILEQEGDALKDPSTKVLTEMTFRTTQRIEMLSGFMRDKKGQPIVTQPKWVPLDTSLFDEGTNVICRMVYTEMPEFGLVPSENFKLPVQNSIFIIAGSDILKKPGTTGVGTTEVDYKFESKNELSKSIIYARTNIVQQNMQGVNNRMSTTATPRVSASRPSRAPTSTRGMY